MPSIHLDWGQVNISLRIISFGAFRSVVAVCCCLCAADNAAASPWGRAPGELFLISDFEYFRTQSVLKAFNTGADVNSYYRAGGSTYGEFGLTPSVTIGGKAWFGSHWRRESDFVESSGQVLEIEGFAQQKVFQNAFHSGAVKLIVGNAGSRPLDSRPDTPGANLNTSLLFSYGRNIIKKPMKVFVVSEVGLKKRFGADADQVIVDSAIGIEPDNRFLLLTDLYTTFSLQNQSMDGADYDVIKLRPSIVWRPTAKWGLQAGLTQEIAGRNLTLGRGYFVALWSRF